MLAAHVARERCVEQYTKLFEQADPGFSLDSVSERRAGVHHTVVAYTYEKR